MLYSQSNVLMFVGAIFIRFYIICFKDLTNARIFRAFRSIIIIKYTFCCSILILKVFMNSLSFFQVIQEVDFFLNKKFID